MASRSSSDDTQTMMDNLGMQKLMWSAESSDWAGILKSCESVSEVRQPDGTLKSTASVDINELMNVLPPSYLENPSTSEFFNMLKSVSANGTEAAVMSSDQLNSMFVSAVSKPASGMLHSEKPSLHSLAGGILETEEIDTDVVSKTIMEKSGSGQFPGLLASRPSTALEPAATGRRTYPRKKTTNWFALYEESSTLTKPTPKPISEATSNEKKSSDSSSAEVATTLTQLRRGTSGRTRPSTVRKASHQQRTSNNRKKKRRNPEPDEKVYVEPTDDDVLFGRGGRVNHHVGNKRYLTLKDSMQARYLQADKSAKTVISQELVDTVKKWGGRFLKLEDNTDDMWYEVHNTVARKKAGQTLREINTPEVRAKKRAKYAR